MEEGRTCSFRGLSSDEFYVCFQKLIRRVNLKFAFEKFPEISKIIFPLPKGISKVFFRDIESRVFLSEKRSHDRFSSHFALPVIIFHFQQIFCWQLFFIVVG